MIKIFCSNLLKRSRKYQIVFYCKKHKAYIDYRTDCKNCLDFNFKRNKPILKRTSKQNKLEKERDKNLNKSGYCGYCGKYCGKLDSHEVYGGSNRKRSIQNGFVKLLCRKCHENEKILQELKKKTQKEFERTRTREEFIKIIGKSYL